MLLLLQYHGHDAIDVVMQIWYSPFLTDDQLSFVQTFYTKKLIDYKGGDIKWVIKQKKLEFQHCLNKINLNEADVVLYWLCHAIARTCTSNDVKKFDVLRDNVVMNPTRTDVRYSYMKYLKPHHRVSWNYYRQYGLFLPFGTFNAHFNLPNKFIYDPFTDDWIVPDCIDPTDGWDMNKVLEFGKSINLPKNDLMGNLYFYVRDRLCKVANLFQTNQLTFDIYCQDACELAKICLKQVMKFDRIDVSNICDDNYLGLDQILTDWSPLLNDKNKYSALITCFINWRSLQNQWSFETNLGETEKLIQKYGILKVQSALAMSVNGNEGMLKSLMDFSDSMNRYLAKKVTPEGYMVKRRKIHQIVPHRFFAPIEASDSFTFVNSSEDEIYNAVCLSKNTLQECYVEWCLK